MSRLLIYNPTCEMAVQNNSVSYQPPLRLQEFEKAMSSLMMYLALEGDMLVGEAPDDELCAFWQSFGVVIPRFVDKQRAMEALEVGAVLQPWGGSRQLYYCFGRRAEADTFTSDKRRFFSRATSVEMESAVADIVKNASAYPHKYHISELSTILESADEMEARVRRGMCAVKSMWSSSGRGVQLVRKAQHIEPAITWARGKIRHDGGVVCEPFYRRLGEFTTLLYIRPDGEVEYIGTNYFEADEAGRFGKELLGRKSLSATEETEIATILSEAIKQLRWHDKYVGPVGIDGMAYEETSGERRLRCCTEVNMRHTMGNVNLAVAETISPTSEGEWQIEQFENVDAWMRHCDNMSGRYPLTTDERGKIKSGFIRLTPLGYNYGAWGIIKEKEDKP